jgi:cell division protein FtsZ
MGGGTGTGAAPLVARIARSLGILTVGIVTKPFHFEGRKRMEQAEEGIRKLIEHVDALITIPNQNLIANSTRRHTLEECYRQADDVLRQAVQGISDLITKTGYINVDFADVRKVMANRGQALMGVGQASGDTKGTAAARLAINNPLLEDSCIDGAEAILINITSGHGFSIMEYQEIVEVVREKVADDAEIICGNVFDDRYKDEVLVTVIATGFKRVRERAQQQPGAEDLVSSNDFLMGTRQPLPSLTPSAQPALRELTTFPPAGSYTGVSNDNYEIPTFLRKYPRR